MISNTVCSGVYDGRNYSVDLSTIKRVELSDLKKNESVIYGISGNLANVSIDSSLYIGSAKDNRGRIKNEHIPSLVKNDHYNNHLQNYFNKYGADNLCYFIMEKCVESELTKREQSWLDFYNCNHEHKVLFNISKFSDRPNPLTKEQREKLSEIKSKYFIITHPSGKEERIKNLEKFCREHNLWAPNMKKVAIGITSHTHGYKCRFDGEASQRYVKNPHNGGKVTALRVAKEYIITFPDGHEEQIKNLSQFCKKHNLRDDSLRHVCAGRISHSNGFKCRYITDERQKYIPKSMPKWTEQRRKTMENRYREYIIVFPDGSEIQINSLNRFCKENNLNIGNMSLVLNGKQDSHKNFKCRYVDPKDFKLKKWKLRGRSKNKYKLTGPDNIEYITNELSTFCEEHNLHYGILMDILRGRQKQHRGFRIEKIKDV
jgi:hypothetical protein